MRVPEEESVIGFDDIPWASLTVERSARKIVDVDTDFARPMVRPWPTRMISLQGG